MRSTNQTFRPKACVRFITFATHSRTNTDASGDQYISGSPFENPIRALMRDADGKTAASKQQCALLRAAYFASFSDSF